MLPIPYVKQRAARWAIWWVERNREAHLPPRVLVGLAITLDPPYGIMR